MGWYDNHILPHLINLSCGTKPVRKQRQKIVPAASGNVLEIGFGGGLNLPYYDRSKVVKVWGLEPAEGMRKLAAEPIAAAGMDVELIELPGEEIPLEAASVDTVLVTCIFPGRRFSRTTTGVPRRFVEPGIGNEL